MKYAYVIIPFFYLLLFVSCSNKKQINFNNIVIDSFDKKTIELTNIISNIEVLPLQPDTNNIIGNIKDICFIDNTVYLLDNITSSVFAFDINDGSFIKGICNKGNGPNEYINPVAISSDSMYVYLLDLPGMSIICFDKQLNAIKKISITFPASDFICTDDGFLLYNLGTSEATKKFVYIDLNGKIVNSYISVEETDQSGGYTGGLGKYFSKDMDNNIYVSESYSNEIYSWKKDSISLAYTINFSGSNIPLGMKTSEIDMFKEAYAFNCNLFFFPNTIVTSFFYKSNRYYNFLSKSTGKQKTGIIMDKNDEIPFFPQWQYKDKLVGTCQYEHVKKYISDPNKHSHLWKNIKSADDETSILIFFQLKESV